MTVSNAITKRPEIVHALYRSKPTGDGVYWWRADKADKTPDAVQVSGDVFYDFGQQKPVSVSIGEFLGPITAADTEQLVRLRKLLRQCLPYVLSAAEAAKMMDGFKPREHKEHRLAAEILDAVDDNELRAALGVKEGEK